MFASVRNTKKFTGRYCLKKAHSFISHRGDQGEHWEVVENNTGRVVLYRRRKLEN